MADVLMNGNWGSERLLAFCHPPAVSATHMIRKLNFLEIEFSGFDGIRVRRF
jgi:hypothetical protein